MRETQLAVTVSSVALVWLCAWCCVTGGQDHPPGVVKTEPENGDTNVDPALEFISVTYDGDMDTRGYSWVRCAGTYPKTTGRPEWRNRRQCVLPVDLEPDRQYEVGLNSTQFQNFRSAAGIPAVPYTLTFRTRTTGKPMKAKAMSSAANQKVIDELRQAVRTRYAYGGLRKVKWDSLFKQYASALKHAETPGQFAAEAAKLLSHADDPHIWLTVGNEYFRTCQREAKLNCNPQLLATVVENWRERSKVVATGTLGDGIGYISISSWSNKGGEEPFEPAFEALGDFGKMRGLAVDVRLNSGGSETIAGKFAGCFVDESKAYAKNINIDLAAKSGFSEVHERTFQPNTHGPKYRGRIVVLMGQCNMSSCEAFLLMMKQVPNCTLVGERSYGSSGNPKPVPLSNGVTVYLPSWQALRLDGTCFEGEGIEPDIEVVASREEFLKRDPVIEKAVSLLGR